MPGPTPAPYAPSVSRGAAALLVASAASFTLVHCVTEGDVLLTKARDTGLSDAGLDSGRDAGAPDTRLLHCGNREAGPCLAATEQCCAAILGFSCPAVGACDGGVIACDQPAHCGAGLRCCGQSAGFLLEASCKPGPCTQFDLCRRDLDCPTGRTCVPGLAGYTFCE